IVAGLFDRQPTDSIRAIERQCVFRYGSSVGLVVILTPQVNHGEGRRTPLRAIDAKVVPVRLTVSSVLIDLTFHMAAKACITNAIGLREVSAFEIPMDRDRIFRRVMECLRNRDLRSQKRTSGHLQQCTSIDAYHS